MPGMRIGDLSVADDGRLLVGVSEGGLQQLAGDKLESYPIRDAMNGNRRLPDRNVDSNKMLRDPDGGLWIGTRQRGLIHLHIGRTDIFTKPDGLSGDISCSLFEDREGNVWYGSSRGLDRFRDQSVTTISPKQGLSSEAAMSLIAGKDGSVWVATRDGLNRWKNGQTIVFRKANGLPADFVQSLFEDERGRVWATFPTHGLSYFENGRFVGVPDLPSEEVYSIGGEDKDIRDRHLVETFPWLVGDVPSTGQVRQPLVAGKPEIGCSSRQGRGRADCDSK